MLPFVKMQISIAFLVCFGVCIDYGAAQQQPQREYKQVTQLPPDVPSCKEKDSDLNACIKSAFQQMIPRMRNGVPELNIPPLDPFVLEKTTYDYANGIIQGRISLKNVQVYGLSEGVVDKVDFELKDGHFTMEMESHVPKIYVEGSYKANMKFNDMKMTPKGYFNVTMTDITMKAKPEGELYERDGHTYLRLSKFSAEPDVGDMHIYASGLFPDPTLNAVILDFINQYWRQIYQAVLPESRSTWEPLLLKNANEFFSALPFDLLVTKE